MRFLDVAPVFNLINGLKNGKQEGKSGSNTDIISFKWIHVACKK